MTTVFCQSEGIVGGLGGPPTLEPPWKATTEFLGTLNVAFPLLSTVIVVPVQLDPDISPLKTSQ